MTWKHNFCNNFDEVDMTNSRLYHDLQPLPYVVVINMDIKCNTCKC